MLESHSNMIESGEWKTGPIKNRSTTHTLYLCSRRSDDDFFRAGWSLPLYSDACAFFPKWQGLLAKCTCKDENVLHKAMADSIRTSQSFVIMCLWSLNIKFNVSKTES